MNTRKHNRSGGFTLIELLAVILIICLLAGILVPSVLRIYDQYQTNIIRMRVAIIDGGVQAYRADFGDFPPSWVRDPDDPNILNGDTRYSTNQTPGAQLIYEYLTGYCHDLGINPGDPPDGIPFRNPNDANEKRFILSQKTSNGQPVDNTDDGAEGWGFRAAPRGPVHGPYNNAQDLPARIYSVYCIEPHITAPPLYAPRPVFVDVLNYPILYYSYHLVRRENGDFEDDPTKQGLGINGYDYRDNYKSEMVFIDWRTPENFKHLYVENDQSRWDGFQQGPRSNGTAGRNVSPSGVSDPIDGDYLGINAYASNFKTFPTGSYGTYPFFRTDYIILSRGLNQRWDAPSPPPQTGIVIPPSDDVTNFYNQ